MKYRGITKKTAEWIGMGASVLGGYVAIDGPRILRMSGESVEHYWRGNEKDAPPMTLCPDGNYVVRDNYIFSGQDLIMAVPDSAVADEGYPIPLQFMALLRPEMEAAGYAVEVQKDSAT